MKKIATLLLTLLILGGCSEEPKEPTELERCIEANLIKDERREKFDRFLKKYGWERMTWTDVDGDEEDRRTELYYDEVVDKYNSLENEIIECEGDFYYDFFESKNIPAPRTKEEIRKVFTPELDAEYKLYYEQRSLEECGYIEEEYLNKATKICHSQGVY